MSCIYCLNGARTYKKNDNLRMSREVALTSVERCLGSLLYGGILEVIFFGGEPFLNWPLAKEVITYCEEELRGKHPDKEFRYHFTSNLTFLPKDLIEWAHKFNITFLCDVDGPEEIHDKCRPFKRNKPSHAVIVKNIDRLTRSGIEVCLRATVTSANHDRLLEITQHHKEIGGKSSAFVPVNPVNSDEDILSEAMLPSPGKIMEGMRKVYKSRLWEDELLYPFNQYVPRLRPGGRAVHGCGAPYGGTPVIDTGGNAYPCIYLVGIERFHMGNVMDESYPNRNLVRWMRDYLHVDNREDCKSCPWRYVCGGGCALGLLTVVHNPKASAKVKDYYRLIRCEYTKKMLELMLWDRAERAASSALESNFAEPVAANRIHC